MAGFLELPGWALPLARRVLFLWVRTHVLPEPPASLGLDPDKPVCYVFQHHHLSNLLVLAEETQKAGLPFSDAPLRLGKTQAPRSAFSLTRNFSVLASARERYALPPLMTQIVEEIVNDPELDIQIVPVVILWGRRPDKQESILKALFSETWRQPNPLSRLLAILLHGRDVMVRFNAPLSLRDLLSDNPSLELGQRILARVLRVHFRRQREMAIGPDLSHRNTQIDTVLAGQPVRQAIAAEAESRGISLSEAELQARRFALEIASDFTYGAVRALSLFLSWLWPRLYDGFQVHNVDVLTRIAPGQGIVYTPTHRSHIDYLLLSYLLHRNGLAPPHIAAGANLNMPLIGPLLRRCGAFFLRRSFKGEPLYAAVFHEYLHLMMTRGFPLEYFIEGGRSRSGKMLPPKAGILGMTVRSFIREHERPLVFVPVYIGYEKVMEGKTYLREMAGKPKQKESLLGVLLSARKIKRVFGNVHLNFGEPLPLAEFLDTHTPGWSGWHELPAGGPERSRSATQAAAHELTLRTNEAAVINPINLIALSLLSTPRQTADETALLRMLAHLQSLTEQVPYAAATVRCPLDPAQIIAYAERLGIIRRIAHPLGDLIQVPENEAQTLPYFRNNVLHVFALPALIACLVSHNRGLSISRITGALTGILELVTSELFLRWSPETLPEKIRVICDVLAERKLLIRNKDGSVLEAPEANSQEFADLHLLGEAMRPMLERQFLTLALLQRCGSGRKTRQTLENDCHLVAERIGLLYAFGSSEPSEKTMSRTLISALIDAELLREDDTGLLHFDERITTPLAQAELVLPAEVRQTIRRMTGEQVS